MSDFSEAEYLKKIEKYLKGQISEQDLYSWNCGFQDEKLDEKDKFIKIIWATVHQLNETDPDYKTTDEELEYLLSCLKGNTTFNEEDLEKANKRGLKRRFDNLSYN